MHRLLIDAISKKLENLASRLRNTAIHKGIIHEIPNNSTLLGASQHSILEENNPIYTTNLFSCRLLIQHCKETNQTEIYHFSGKKDELDNFLKPNKALIILENKPNNDSPQRHTHSYEVDAYIKNITKKTSYLNYKKPQDNRSTCEVDFSQIPTGNHYLDINNHLCVISVENNTLTIKNHWVIEEAKEQRSTKEFQKI